MTSEPDSMGVVWANLESHYAEGEPHPLPLAPPATDDEITQCERELGFPLPDDLRRAYLHHNGGQLEAFEWYSLEEVVEWWKQCVELAEEDAADRESLDLDEPEWTDDGMIRTVVFDPARIPLASCDSTFVFVDRVPGPHGRPGQIIASVEGIHHVIADGMDDFLRYLRDLLYARKTTHDREFGIHVEDRAELRERLAAEAARAQAAPSDGAGLLRCAVNGDVMGVRRWIDSGRNLEEADRSGWTALLWAINQGHWEVSALLVRAGADVNHGRPLSQAAYQGHVATVRALLDAGADVHARNEDDGRTALHDAAGQGHLDVVRLLLAADADVDAADGERHSSPLMEAARDGHAAVVRLLLEHGADVNARGAERATALMKAAERHGAEPEHAEIVRLLLAGGVDTCVRNWGGTALDHARKRNNEAIVRLLVEERLAGAARRRAVPTGDGIELLRYVVDGDVAAVRAWIDRGSGLEGTDRHGRTALMWAAVCHRWELCRLLVRAGADVNHGNDEWTPLMLAAYHGDLATVRELLDAMADPNATADPEHEPDPDEDDCGTTGLHFAAREGHAEIVRALLAAGADVDATDPIWSDTPLIEAARRGHAAVVRILLDHLADVEVKGTDGATALVQAAGARGAGPEHLETVRLLLASGADRRVRSLEGTALDVAKQRGNDAIADLLAVGPA